MSNVTGQYIVLENNATLSVPLETRKEAYTIVLESKNYNTFMNRKNKTYRIYMAGKLLETILPPRERKYYDQC